MTRVTLDLADPCDVDRLWSAYQRHHAGQQAEPELFDGICQLVADAEDSSRLPRLVCDGIRFELRHSRPSAVLSAYWRELIEDRPAVGHYLRGEVLADAA